MTIITDTYVPYEFESRQDCLKYIEARTCDIKHSLRFIEKDSEHLTIRCPLSGDYLDIIGTPADIKWIDAQLRIKQWYRR